MIYTDLFWDFDGTLYNSYPQVVLALQNALRACGVPRQPDGEALRLLKISVFDAVNEYAARFGLDVQTLLERFREEHAKVGFFPPYEGLRECLTRLKDAGARHWLYTHRDRKAWEQLERDGLRALFSGGVTAEDGFPLKPAPDALLSMVERYGLDPRTCAMIGDRDIDIGSGKNAGMVGVLFDPDGFYSDLHADLRASGMPELCERILFSASTSSSKLTV